MASVIFQLRDRKSTKETPIMMLFNFGYYEIEKNTGKKKYKFLKVATGEKVNPKYWNDKKYRVKGSKEFPLYYDINKRLDSIETKIKQIHNSFKEDRVKVTPSILKKEFEKWLKGDTDKVTLFQFVEKFIEDTKSGKRTYRGKKLSPNMSSSYIGTLKHLKGYTESRNVSLDFEGITLDFYYDFIDYLYKNTKISSPNGLYTHIKNIKLFMGESHILKLHQNLDFKNKNFTKPAVECDEIYLTDEEIDKIYNLDLSNNKKLEISRDFFIVGCKIALRKSDFTQIRKENYVEIDGTKCLKMRQKKTDNMVVIPLSPLVIGIFEKYDFNLIYPYSNSSINTHLKVIGKMAGIDQEIQKREFVKGKPVNKVYKKYELITSHSGRRSACTNLYKKGVPTQTIMLLSGHTNEATLRKYIRVDEKDHLNILLKAGIAD